jgi:hypothetical protein
MRQEEHKFETSLGYRARPCLKKQKKKKKRKKPVFRARLHVENLQRGSTLKFPAL